MRRYIGCTDMGEEVYDKIINKMCYKLECNECPRSAHDKDDSTLMICTYYKTSSR